MTEAALSAYGSPDAGGLAAVAAAVVEECASGVDAQRALRLSEGPDSPLQLLRMYLG